MVILLRADSELDGVISGRDGLDVIIHIACILLALEEVEVHSRSKVDQNTEAACEQAKHEALRVELVRDHARSLDVKGRFLSALQ